MGEPKNTNSSSRKIHTLNAIKSHIAPIIAILILVWACEPSEEKLTNSGSARLTYSADTVIFDTLFSSVGSITKRLRIFNTNDNAINIDRLSLGLGTSSSYTITVNGIEAPEFTNEIIFGRDSLLVLIKTFIDPGDAELPFLVKDSITVASNGNSEHVKLVAWGQDANFIDGEVIDCNTTWTAGKPYVIYNSALVDTLCTLTVDPGARIFIDNNASLFVKGSLQINGTLEEKVIIRNTRLDPKFNIAPGQWGDLSFLEGTFDNRINYAIISNGTNGVRIGNPDDNDAYDIQISNTIIEHMASSGILAFTSDIYAYNTVIYNCGDLLVGNLAGGNYRYEHCTFSNEPNDFFRDGGPSVIFSDNVVLADNSVLVAELNIAMHNSIIWGKERDEILVDDSGASINALDISNNIIRSSDTSWEDLENIISQERNFPGFFSVGLLDYQLDSLANARDIGLDIGIEKDILGTLRDDEPDFGAYERLDSIQ